jgi:hypothetical protein
MNLTLSALYEIHRHQILLDAIRGGNQRVLPSAYLYALDRRLSPIFHSEWTDREDPFEEAYRPNTKQVQYIYQHLKEAFTLPPQKYQSFNALEKSLGGIKYRYPLRVVLRYCYQSGKFNEQFYDAVLSEGNHPEEALSITRPYTTEDIHLV